MHSVKRILTTENRTCAIRPTAIQSTIFIVIADLVVLSFFISMGISVIFLDFDIYSVKKRISNFEEYPCGSSR